MSIDVRLESAAALDEYALVPVAFQVREVFDVAPRGSDEFALTARALVDAYVKDYDASYGPAEWPHRFDVSNWAFFSAFERGMRIGGATVAGHTPVFDMLDGRHDLATLWDIRVSPTARRTGVGAALFRATADWAAAHGYRCIRIETQNINVAACRFYMQQGCVLGAAHSGVYPGLPEEVQLLWYKDL